ncbi:MAG TPA: ATP-binding cassette domain-containing protein, partial [Kaistiaceae bacterium]|nr:ATP-binding cassette domain-containing protein [Kaistiaceae bacterium]
MNRMTTIATRGLVLERIRIARADRVLIELSLAVAPGEVATVMGPSGVGKSTLLAYVGGFLAPAFTGKGRVKLDGVDVTDVAPALRRIGVLFQDDLLFPHLSVAGNLL